MITRIPPNDTEAEKALLGSILLRKDALLDISEEVTSDMFYSTKHGIIYKAMLSLQSRSEPIDLVSLTQELKSSNSLDEVGGTMYVVELSNSVPVSTNIDNYAKIIQNKYTMRRLIETGENIAEVGFSDKQNAGAAVELATSMVLGMKTDNSKEETDISDIISEFDATQEEFKKKQFGTSKLIGIPSGFSKIDGAIDGLRPGHFWSIAAYCLAKNTGVIMNDGSIKKVQDITVGDKLSQVMQDSPTNVIGIATGKDEMFTISGKYFNDFTVNSGHIIPLICTNNDYSYKGYTIGNIYKFSASEISKMTKRFSRSFKLIRTPMYFDNKKQLDVEPYFLGYWLGDGTTGKSDITVDENDVEPIKYFEEYASRINHRFIIRKDKRNNNVLSCCIVTENGGDITKKPKPLSKILPSVKSIPLEYMKSSIDNRLQLLAGLIDSDGSRSKNMFCFCQKDINLILQVKELAESCGLTCSYSKSYQKESKLVKNCTGNEIYRLFISGNTHTIPCKVSRKIISKPSSKNVTNGIACMNFTIKSIGTGEYYGFELDGNHLFATENFVVNHNTSAGKTSFLLNLINNLITSNPVTFFSLEMSKADIISRLLGIETGIGMTKIMRHEFETPEQVDKFTNARDRLIKSNLKIYSKTNTLDGIILSMTRDMLRNNTKVFCIDYIQLVRTKSKNEYEQITEAAQRLQTFARETGCTIIVLSQVSNEHARDPNQEVHGTKGGGSLPASVDLAIELFNEDKKEERDDKVHDGKPLSVKAIIKKNRHGRCGYVKLDFTPWNGQFKESTDWDV